MAVVVANTAIKLHVLIDCAMANTAGQWHALIDCVMANTAGPFADAHISAGALDLKVALITGMLFVCQKFDNVYGNTYFTTNIKIGG